MQISLVRYRCTIYILFSTTTYDYGCNTESYGPTGIVTNDAGLYPWLFRRPVCEYMTWALKVHIGNWPGPLAAMFLLDQISVIYFC